MPPQVAAAGHIHHRPEPRRHLFKQPPQSFHSDTNEEKEKKMQDSDEEQLEEPLSRRSNRRNLIPWSYRRNYRRPRNLEAEI